MGQQLSAPRLYYRTATTALLAPRVPGQTSYRSPAKVLYLLHNLGTADRVDLAWPYPFFIIFFPSSAAHHDMGVDIIELRPQIAPSAWLRSGQTL